MKPPAPVTQIFIFLCPSVNFFSATEGRTWRRGEAEGWHALAGHLVLVPACPVPVCVCGPHAGPHASCYVGRIGACKVRGRHFGGNAPWLRGVFRRATKLETERSARRCQIGRHQENEINSGLLKFLQPGRAMVTRINGNLTQPYSHPNMLLRWD